VFSRNGVVMTETLETVTKKKPEPTAEQLGHQKNTPAGNEEMQSWRARPLDEVYAAVFTGAIDGSHPPLDPAADIALDLGRGIPPRVRDWALTAEPPSGSDPAVPAWVLDELLRFPE
jgi:hypothetical protein